MTSQAVAPSARIAVIIPSYKVTQHILGVIARIGPEVDRIYVVDDKCPEHSGDFVEKASSDPRVVIIRNTENQGVGGAVIAGYKAAIADNADILVKVDGDGQMDAALIPQLIAPIAQGVADYTKGNRFYAPEALDGMPPLRLIGNAGLSFLTKLSSGYWDILDPTNGFTALHARVAAVLPLHKLSKRYFFESDLLFRLNTVRAVVTDIPMFSYYGEERSNMNAGHMLAPFFAKNLLNFWKRIVYSYFLRGFSFASCCIFFGILLFAFGFGFGLATWIESSLNGRSTPTGTIMLAVVPLFLGFQLLMGFFAADIGSLPTRALHQTLSIWPAKPLRPFNDKRQKEKHAEASKRNRSDAKL